jgi:hypothetical protein
MDNQPISNLDGYLLSLRRLSGNSCDFWAETFQCADDLEKSFSSHLADRGISLIDKSSIGYREIDQVLEEHVFSKLQVEDESLLKLFAWDIVEYLQLSYRFIEPEIDPISSKKAMLLNVESEFHGKFVFMVIPVIDNAIAVGLATRA